MRRLRGVLIVVPPLPAGARPIADPDDPRAVIPGHAVRADGTVLRWIATRRRWIVLRPKVGPHGFVKVRVRVGGKVRELGVALLVLRAWVGPRPLGCEPLHYPDPDPGNNRLDNLRWAPRGTSKAGRTLGPSPPRVVRGDDHHTAVLAEADVPEIRRLYRAGVACPEIAERFGVAEETIRHVLIGRTWSHVPDPLGPIVMRRKGPAPGDAPLAKLDPAQAAEIRGHHAAGMSYREIARLYDVSYITVRDVVKGRTWKGV
jgi:hypothetical protein